MSEPKNERQTYTWEVRACCPHCGEYTVFAGGYSTEDRDNGVFEDHRALCYHCGQSFTAELRTGGIAGDQQNDGMPNNETDNCHLHILPD